MTNTYESRAKYLQLRYGKILDRIEREERNDRGELPRDLGVIPTVYTMILHGWKDIDSATSALVHYAFNQQVQKEFQLMDDIIDKAYPEGKYNVRSVNVNIEEAVKNEQ